MIPLSKVDNKKPRDNFDHRPSPTPLTCIPPFPWYVTMHPCLSPSHPNWNDAMVPECHDFHPFSLTYFLSSKCPNTCSNHDMVFSYLILSYLFTLQSHTKKTGKADSIGIPIEKLSTHRPEQRPTHSPCWSPHPHPSPHQPRTHHC